MEEKKRKRSETMKTIKEKTWAVAVAVTLFLLLGWMLWLNAQSLLPKEIYENNTFLIEGQYSIDGGEWTTIDVKKPIAQPFKKAVFKGHLAEDFDYIKNIRILTKDVWFNFKKADGSSLFNNYSAKIPPDFKLESINKTPGYNLTQIDYFFDESISSKTAVVLEVYFPYQKGTALFSDCFKSIFGDNNTLSMKLLFEGLPTILMFLLVIFFGVFFFPIASGLLGRIDFKYIAFGSLCFFAGLFMVVGIINDYFNIWVTDSIVCMVTDKLVGYLFIIAVLIYLRSLLLSKAKKIIAASLISAFLILVFVNIILQVTNTADMMATIPSKNIMTTISAVLMTVLLCMEIKGRKKLELIEYLLSWIPLVVTLLLDVFDSYLHFSGVTHLQIGLAVTIVYQIIRFARDFRQQYLEAIHYQHVQKELYEAKVNVMVSQIRPHFMYNALTSIAMMCEIDPKTAEEATITFAKYLRGNMDSLKQTTPVPFTQELEHLKKYLYIEKLRFDDLLNIEYDIQTTDFVLPLLSIQPLVENAVKHGVGMKEDGGTVRISTRETDKAYEVIIEDDGVGFDVNEQKNDGKTHVGMENTKKRLRDMCSGEVIISSELEKGTVVTVVLPKEGQQGENTLS